MIFSTVKPNQMKSEPFVHVILFQDAINYLLSSNDDR
jgi:hypothetical protein